LRSSESSLPTLGTEISKTAIAGGKVRIAASKEFLSVQRANILKSLCSSDSGGKFWEAENHHRQ
jgi:hypothetical protein